MELLKNIRAYEDVFFEDPEENPDTPRFRVWFDDKHIEEYLAKVGNAIDRAQANEQMAREADTPEKAARPTPWTSRRSPTRRYAGSTERSPATYRGHLRPKERNEAWQRTSLRSTSRRPT